MFETCTKFIAQFNENDNFSCQFFSLKLNLYSIDVFPHSKWANVWSDGTTQYRIIDGNLLKSTYSSSPMLKQEQETAFLHLKWRDHWALFLYLTPLRPRVVNQPNSDQTRNGGEESTMEFHFFSFWWLVNNGVEDEWVNDIQVFKATLSLRRLRLALTEGYSKLQSPLNSTSRQTSSSEFSVSQLHAFKVIHISPFPNI